MDIRQTSSLAPTLNAVANEQRRTYLEFNHRAVVQAIVKRCMETLSLVVSQRMFFHRLYSVANDIKDALSGRSELHIFVNIKDPTLFDGRDVIAPLFSLPWTLRSPSDEDARNRAGITGAHFRALVPCKVLG